ncbi:MAG: hypothetical protein M3Q44_06175 [bacterium]|nr:hypothetical protein [bacterium]
MDSRVCAPDAISTHAFLTKSNCSGSGMFTCLPSILEDKYPTRGRPRAYPASTRFLIPSKVRWLFVALSNRAAAASMVSKNSPAGLSSVGSVTDTILMPYSARRFFMAKKSNVSREIRSIL